MTIIDIMPVLLLPIGLLGVSYSISTFIKQQSQVYQALPTSKMEEILSIVRMIVSENNTN